MKGSGLVHRAEQVEESGADYLTCHRCQSVVGLAQIARLDVSECGDLRCAECGLSGFVPRSIGRGRGVGEKYGDVLGADWTPVPRALHRHGHQLGLTATDLALITALESFRFHASSKVYPGLESIAQRAWTSRTTAHRYLKRLEALGLLRRTPLKDRGRYHRCEYDLTPLWNALEAIELRERQASAQGPTTFQSGTRPRSDLEREVEEVREVDAALRAAPENPAAPPYSTSVPSDPERGVDPNTGNEEKEDRSLAAMRLVQERLPGASVNEKIAAVQKMLSESADAA